MAQTHKAGQAPCNIPYGARSGATTTGHIRTAISPGLGQGAYKRLGASCRVRATANRMAAISGTHAVEGLSGRITTPEGPSPNFDRSNGPVKPGRHRGKLRREGITERLPGYGVGSRHPGRHRPWPTLRFEMPGAPASVSWPARDPQRGRQWRTHSHSHSHSRAKPDMHRFKAYVRTRPRALPQEKPPTRTWRPLTTLSLVGITIETCPTFVASDRS